jgi:hypothetical protein
MNISDFFEIVGDHAVFHPVCNVSLDQMVEIVTAAITLAHEKKIFKLLVDTTDLTGFESPTLASRYFFIKEWAKAARGVRICVVAKPVMIDPQKFGVTVAYNHGLISEVFPSKEESLAWLENIKLAWLENIK